MKLTLSILLTVAFLGVFSLAYSANNAISLDGINDYVDVSTGVLSAGMDGASGITLEAWINPTTLKTGADTNRNLIVDFGIGGTDSMVSMYLREGGKIRFGGRSRVLDAFQDVVTSSPVISTGSWQHVAGVLDFTGKKIFIYVNGALVASKTVGVAFGSNTFQKGGSILKQYIGASASLSSTQFFHGKIDDLRLWSVVRTATEINDFRETEIPAQAGLLGYWKFNGTSPSQTAIDETGTYNGTLLPNGYANGPQWETGPDITLPVELSSFTAVLTADYFVKLQWTTQSETGVSGFYIYRGLDSNVANAITVSPMIDATNTSDVQHYEFIDDELYEDATYYYWLLVQDLDGSVNYHGPFSVYYNANTNGNQGTPGIPAISGLQAIYPNPFNANAVISYGLRDASTAVFTIYNTRGQIVRSFSDGQKAAGNWKVLWNGMDNSGKACSIGVYYIKMQAGNDRSIRKAVLMK